MRWKNKISSQIDFYDLVRFPWEKRCDVWKRMKIASISNRGSQSPLFGSRTLFYDITINILKIDSINWSFCLCHVCKNGPSYLGEETRPTLCKSAAKLGSSVRDLKQNKYQLLCRIQSIRTALIYNIKREGSQGK